MRRRDSRRQLAGENGERLAYLQGAVGTVGRDIGEETQDPLATRWSARKGIDMEARSSCGEWARSAISSGRKLVRSISSAAR
jgi:hypothetical protein